jgi:hypothetical protein
MVVLTPLHFVDRLVVLQAPRRLAGAGKGGIVKTTLWRTALAPPPLPSRS